MSWHVETTDARGSTEVRVVDALDRVTFVDFDTTHTYDDPAVPFSLGRLTAISRNGHSVDYGYDRFGRTIQDGELTFGYDDNGNRTGIGYPGGVTATYDHDFADRETSLSVTTASGATPVVTSATYLPSDSLTSLTFGTGAVETRTFTPRYFPESIALDAETDRTWAYTDTDAIGKIRRIEEVPACAGDLLLANATVTGTEVQQSCAGIEAGPSYTVDSTGELTLQAATTVVLKDGFSVASGGKLTVGTDPSLDGTVVREYQYQDVDYFLTDATGPWGSLGWSYDQIGNRLTETDNGLTDGYDYVPNALGGNTALLSSTALGVGGTRSFGYTPAGHQTQVNSAPALLSRPRSLLAQFDSLGELRPCVAGRELSSLSPGRCLLHSHRLGTGLVAAGPAHCESLPSLLRQHALDARSASVSHFVRADTSDGNALRGGDWLSVEANQEWKWVTPLGWRSSPPSWK